MAKIDVEVIISAVDRASSTLKSFGDTASSVHDRFGDLLKASTAASFAFAGALTLTGKSILDIASDMEQTKVAFDTMIGNAKLSSKTLKDLADFAKKTPFDLPQVLEGSKRLLAYNIEAKDLIPTFTMLGNLAAGVGRDKLPQLILAFGQVKAATRLTGMELRQFSETGIPLLGALADQAGVTAAEMKKMIESGEVSFDDVQKALMGMTSEGGKFFNLMDKQSKTFGGIVSNIRDQLVRVALNVAGISTEAETFGQVIEGGAFDRFRDAMQKILDVLNALEPKVRGFIQTFTENGVLVGVVLGAITAGLLGAAAATIAFLAPWLTIVAIGAAVGAAIGFVINSLGGLQAVTEGVSEAWNRLVGIYNALVKPALDQLFSVIQSQLIPQLQRLWDLVGPILGPVLSALAQIVVGVVIVALRVFIEVLIVLATQIANAIKFVLDLKDIVSSAFGSISNIIKSFGATASSVFNSVRGAVDGVTNAIHNLVSSAENLANRVRGGLKLPGFQAGGIVPGAIGEPRMIMAHGGEEVVPVGKSGGGGIGGAGLVFNVNIGMYAGSEIEKRNVASNLYKALVTVARAQNKTVAEVMGG